MPNDLIIRVIGDTKPFEKSVARSTQTAKGFEATLKKVAITAEASANTRVAASVRANARLREEIAAYRSIASASAKGSREQVAAANLAVSAEKRLARSLATTSTEARALSRSTVAFDRDFSRASRGVLAGSGLFRSLGRSLAFGSTSFLGGVGASFIGRQLIDQASRVQEEVEKSNVVFGANARQVEAWSRTLSQSFGVSTGAALEATGRFGNMLRPLGFAAPAAAKMSERLVELAADMASFNNTKPDVVLEALSSGIAGQVRPLRQFGVFLSAARIQTEAYQDGIAKTGAKLTQAQKVQAAYNIILKDTKSAQGDVARNTGSLSVAQSKLTAGIQDLEASLGAALIPSLTEYINTAAAWLNQTENQQRIQHDFTTALHDTTAVLKTLTEGIRAAKDAVGGFKNLVEILIGFKVASVLLRWTEGFRGVGLAAGEKGAAGKVGLLRSRLAGLNALTIAPIVIPIELALLDKERNFVKDKLGDVGKIGFDIAQAIAAGGTGNLAKDIADIFKKQAEKGAKLPKPKADVGFRDFRFDEGLGEAIRQQTALTAKQRNTFFDNALARVLLRTGLGTIQQQISGLQKANALIAERLKVTKDVTRRLNLEDQLLQNAAQIKSLNAQQAADALQKRQEVVSELIANLQLGVTKAQATAPFGDDIAALKALQAGIKAEIREFGNTADLAGQLFDVQQQIKQAKVSNITANLFKQLGLTATGDEITPGVANLKKRLAQITENVSGLKFDTPKLEAQLARFRKVLSEGLVPKDVRAKIKSMFDDIADEIKNAGARNETKFRHVNSNLVLAGLGLTPEQIRALRGRIATIGAGGTVPPSRSLAFSGAGATTVVESNTYLDGQKIAKTVTKHQQKNGTRRAVPRRGTYAGKH